MPRFTAPADTRGISLSTGFHSVRDGIVEVPDEMLAADRLGLAANGFVPVLAVADAKAKKPSVDAPVPASEAE